MVWGRVNVHAEICGDGQDAFAGKPRSYRTAVLFVGARLAREGLTSVTN